jgi:hypothetical protein
VDAPLAMVARRVIDSIYMRMFGIGYEQRISELLLNDAVIADRID